MIIYDENQDSTLKIILVLLTVDEAKNLRDSLDSLLKGPLVPGDHHHVSNKNFSKEIIVSIYQRDHNLNGFHERIKQLIKQEG
jgi:hypothetical protein